LQSLRQRLARPRASHPALARASRRGREQKEPRTRRARMDLYVILRRSGWRSADDLALAAARSGQVGDDEMPDEVRWIRSYVLDEGAGSVGTVCIYEATSPDALRKHASLADLPADEIIRVVDTVLV